MEKNTPSQLYWACRRGMLELDVLLGNFLKEVYPALSPTNQSLFVRLLSNNDQDLFMWLTGKETALDPELNEMVRLIRQHAKNRHSAPSF